MLLLIRMPLILSINFQVPIVYENDYEHVNPNIASKFVQLIT